MKLLSQGIWIKLLSSCFPARRRRNFNAVKTSVVGGVYSPNRLIRDAVDFSAIYALPAPCKSATRPRHTAAGIFPLNIATLKLSWRKLRCGQSTVAYNTDFNLAISRCPRCLAENGKQISLKYITHLNEIAVVAAFKKVHGCNSVLKSRRKVVNFKVSVEKYFLVVKQMIASGRRILGNLSKLQRFQDEISLELFVNRTNTAYATDATFKGVQKKYLKEDDQLNDAKALLEHGLTREILNIELSVQWGG